ncbi:MAG: choice-of-anchor D domain-containing protein [Candidatus Latescibacteria bacterium]|nr:choice-of-anchor D domain-containing protein [Candidatus Latescibacterota bacterium]
MTALVCAWILVLEVGIARALTLSVADVSASPGQAGVSVSVKTDNAKDIAGGDMTISYDAKVLTAKKAKGADLLTMAGITVVSNLATAGQVKVSMAGVAGITSGSGVLVDITFDVKAGATPGAYTVNLQADLSDENGASLPVTVKKGSFTIKTAASAVAPLTISAKNVGFDSTTVGSTSRKTLTLGNTGSSSLSITRVSVSGADASQFQVTPSQLSISAKGNQNLNLAFAPTSAGAKSASLTITYSGTGSPVTVSLSGKGFVAAPLMVSAKSVGFDSTQVGSTNRKTLTLGNTGGSSLSIAKASISGTDASQFQVTPTQVSIPSKGSQNLNLTFTPTSAGFKSASLTITYSGNGSPVTVSLNGKGFVAQATGLQVSVGSATGTLGSTVAVPVSVNSAKGIAGGDLALSYDARVLRVKEVKGADLLNAAGFTVIPNTSTAGRVQIAMAGASGMTSGSGALLNVSFEVLANAVPGAYELKLEAALSDENGIALAATTRNGALTVKAKTGKSIGHNELPVSTVLLSNYPNPFNSTTVMSYQMADRGRVKLAIYNLLGQQVRVLVDRVDEPGIYAMPWDGEDDQGQQLSSGMYIYQLVANGRVESKRLLLLK